MNELSNEVKAKEIHEKAIGYFKISEQYGYKFIMEVKKIRDEKLFNALGFESFDDYCRSCFGFERDYMNERIRIANEFGKEYDGYSRSIGHKKSLFLARMPEEQREKAIIEGIPTNKGNKSIDEATQQEIREYQQKLKQEQQARQQAEQDNRKLGQLLAEEQNKEPEVIEKEVVPNYIKEQLQEKDRFLKATKREYEQLQQELKILKAQSDDSDDGLSEQKLKRLEREASIETMELAVNIRRFLKDASLTQYQIGALANASESYKKKTLENVEILEQFVKNIKTALNGRIEI